MGRVVVCAAIFIVVYLICYALLGYLSIWGELISLEIWHRA